MKPLLSKCSLLVPILLVWLATPALGDPAYDNLVGRVRGQNSGWEVAALSEPVTGPSVYDTLDTTWPEPVTDREFEFQYHSSTGIASLWVQGVGTVNSDDIGYTGYGFENVYLQAMARNGDTLTISNILFNGTPQPDFTAPDNFDDWSRTLYSGSALEDIVVSGAFSATGLSGGSAEETKLQVRVDNEPPAHDSHETHRDDPKGPQLGDDCTACHTGTPETAENVDWGACDSCHSPEGAFDGVALAVSFWSTGAYDGDGNPKDAYWCASCHDDVPAYSRPVVVTLTKVVVDNDDPEFEALPPSPDADRWRCKEQSGAYNGTRCHNSAGTGSAIATWTPTLADTGNYRVYARWVPGASRATNAPYTINYNGGSVTIDVNQKTGGLDWEELTSTVGPLPFASGSSGSVVLSDDADGYVVADAIQWELDVPGVESGTYAPNVIGDNTTYGHYVTGHKESCITCHDAEKDHIDHEHRTYESALDNYQIAYRLWSVGGDQPMDVPRKRNADVYAVLNDFSLCGDCHNLYEVLGQDIDDVSHTNFCSDGVYHANLHTYHLEILDNKNTDSDRNGSGDTAPTCIGCHNLHGTPNQAMLRHGELINVNDIFPPDWAALNFCYLTSMGPLLVGDPAASLANSVGGIMDWGGNSIPYNGTCKASCHGTPVYERAPKLWPKVLNAKAKPDAVPNDGSGSTLITAFVSDPDGDFDPDGGTGSIGVDLTDIDPVLGTQSLEDAGGGYYSLLVTIPEGASEGEKILLVTATDDALNTGENVITLSVTAPGVVVVDNSDVEFEAVPISPDPDRWRCKEQSGSYNGTRCHNSPGTGSATATWTPDITDAGDYEVYAWWTDGSSRASDAPYTIYYDGGSETVYVNQRIDGSQWNLLGTYRFAAGTSGLVVLSDKAGGYVIADAVRLELQTP